MPGVTDDEPVPPRHPQGWLVARVYLETTQEEDELIAENRRKQGLPPLPEPEVPSEP